MKTKVVSVDRVAFVEKRYADFLAKKKMLGGVSREGFYMTDLDRDYGDGVVKDLVLCDACMKNITEPVFIMVEDQLVYHLKCSAERAGVPDNVVGFKPRREE